MFETYGDHLLAISANFDIIVVMNKLPADLVSFAKALADDTRQEIMKQLCCVWLSVNEVVEKLDGRVNQPTVSHHLKILQEANLVFGRQEGRQHFYSLNEEYFSVCCGFLMKSFAPGKIATIISPNDIG